MLMQGTTRQLVATVIPEGTPITWVSDNPEYVTVDNSGVVTAIKHNHEYPRGVPDAQIIAIITVNGVNYSDQCLVSVDYPE